MLGLLTVLGARKKWLFPPFFRKLDFKSVVESQPGIKHFILYDFSNKMDRKPTSVNIKIGGYV